jgi:hypothetical protein
MAKYFEYRIITIDNLITIGNDSPGKKDLSGQFKLDPLKDGLDDLGSQGWELCSTWGDDRNTHFIFKKEM